MELYEMRAICNGADHILVESVGSETALQLMNEGANIQALKLKMSQPMKDAKQNMKEAKRLARENNTGGAIKAYDAAIKNLRELQKAAEEIDDDHIVMVTIDAFIKGFIPMMAGALVSIYTPLGTVAYIIGMVGAYICGLSKSLDFSAAVEKNLVQPNKAGINGKFDSAIWWKIGETRGAVMTKLDRMITACELAKKKLK